MTWDSIKNIVSKFAPVLGNAIVPGVGGVAGSLIAEALETENTPDAIESAIADMTPETALKIKGIETSHRETLIGLGIERDKLYISDVQNARQREIDISKITGKKDINLYILAWTVVIGFFGLMAALMKINLPVENIGPVNQLFGTLGTGFGLVLGYFFGSSKGSADKTALLSNNK